MKAKDIEVGKEYAIQQYAGHFRRAVVVQVGDVTRRVYNGSTFYGHNSTSKMASVVYVNQVTGLAPEGSRVEHVVLAKVACIWDEYAERKTQADTRVATLNARFDDLQDRLLIATGIQVYISRHNSRGHSIGSAIINASNILKIIEALEAK